MSSVGLAPAKLNLLLKVFDKRRDNYHNILSLYQLISWQDIISISRSSTTTITVSGPYAEQVPQGQNIEHNLLWRAYQLMHDEADKLNIELPPLSISLQKNIPIGAGLGGGSSDAASIMKMLRILWLPQMPLSRLLELGASLGADIPVFIRGFSAWTGGIGEQLLPQPLNKYHYLVFSPSIHSNTKELFAKLDNHKDNSRAPYSDIYKGGGNIADMENLPSATAWLNMNTDEANDFFHPLCHKFPQLAEFYKTINAMTSNKLAANIFLSGSGSSMFAVYDGKTQALQDQQQILDACPQASLYSTKANFIRSTKINTKASASLAFVIHLVQGINCTGGIVYNI